MCGSVENPAMMTDDDATERAVESDDLPMRVGFRTRSLADERLRFIKQLGVEDVFVDRVGTDEGPEEFLDLDAADAPTVMIDDHHIPSVEELAQAKSRAANVGVRFAGIQSLPFAAYGKIMLGEEGADRQVEKIKQLVRNMGAAGIPTLGYQWNPRGEVIMRTSGSESIRGGAKTTAFDLDALDDPETATDPDAPEYDEDAFWDRYEGFLQEVLPVAEEAGVRMALHPADPPTIPQLEGVPRLFRSIETFERGMDLVPSDNHGLKLCLGCFSEMGEDVTEVIRRFGERDEIVFVHFRDVVGTMPAFREGFVDEGNFDVLAAMEALDEVGFDGVMVPDHVPRMEGDSGWQHRSRAFTAGYLRGVLDTVRRDER